MGEEKGTTEYAIKQVGDRYHPVIIDSDAGGHYEIKNPLTGGVLELQEPRSRANSYNAPARKKDRRAVHAP